MHLLYWVTRDDKALASYQSSVKIKVIDPINVFYYVKKCNDSGIHFTTTISRLTSNIFLWKNLQSNQKQLYNKHT